MTYLAPDSTCLSFISKMISKFISRCEVGEENMFISL